MDPVDPDSDPQHWLLGIIFILVVEKLLLEYERYGISCYLKRSFGIFLSGPCHEIDIL